MIDLYTWTTPNGEKPVIMLEECGIDYDLHLVDISSGEQKNSDFLEINPNGKIPALVEGDVRVFESGAILLYMAERHGCFLPDSGSARYETLSWTFFQVGGTGPMLGQLHHFENAAPDEIPYAIERYAKESKRLLGVLDRRLTGRDYLVNEFTIADIMNVSWARAGLKELSLADEMPALAAWVERMDAREGTRRALDRLERARRERDA